jgi:hypothetical protein
LARSPAWLGVVCCLAVSRSRGAQPGAGGDDRRRMDGLGDPIALATIPNRVIARLLARSSSRQQRQPLLPSKAIAPIRGPSLPDRATVDNRRCLQNPRQARSPASRQLRSQPSRKSDAARAHRQSERRVMRIASREWRPCMPAVAPMRASRSRGAIASRRRSLRYLRRKKVSLAASPRCIPGCRPRREGGPPRGRPCERTRRRGS